MLTIREIECIIESVLFTAGDPVPLEKLADICSQDKKTMQGILENYAGELLNNARGLMLRELAGTWQLCTKPAYADYIVQLGTVRKAPGLTQAAYETLSIIAYRQPATRAVIEQIRGVSSDGVLLKLQEKNLIREAGRDDTPGKPFLFETTTEFLRAFGFNSIRDLPGLEMNELKETEFLMENLPVD
jgi:segregation and condensation protein B